MDEDRFCIVKVANGWQNIYPLTEIYEAGKNNDYQTPVTISTLKKARYGSAQTLRVWNEHGAVVVTVLRTGKTIEELEDYLGKGKRLPKPKIKYCTPTIRHEDNSKRTIKNELLKAKHDKKKHRQALSEIQLKADKSIAAGSFTKTKGMIVEENVLRRKNNKRNGKQNVLVKRNEEGYEEENELEKNNKKEFVLKTHNSSVINSVQLVPPSLSPLINKKDNCLRERKSKGKNREEQRQNCARPIIRKVECVKPKIKIVSSPRRNNKPVETAYSDEMSISITPLTSRDYTTAAQFDSFEEQTHESINSQQPLRNCESEEQQKSAVDGDVNDVSEGTCETKLMAKVIRTTIREEFRHFSGGVTPQTLATADEGKAIVTPHVKLTYECLGKMYSAKSMKMRLNHLLSEYWSAADRKRLILSKDKRLPDALIVQADDIAKIKQVLSVVQRRRELKGDENEGWEFKIRSWISKKLKSARYTQKKSKETDKKEKEKEQEDEYEEEERE